VLVEEHRVIIAARLVKSLFFQVGGQQGDSAAVQGDVAGLAALAGQRRQGRVLEADVADGQVGDFLDPGAGVVERGEQGRVAPALPGGPVGPGEQEPGLLDGQVPDGGTVLFLGGDGEDVLPAGHPGRVLGLHPRGERADRGQPLVAGRDAVAPVFLQVAEECGDGAGVEVVEGEPGRRDGPLVAEPGDQEPERVAVGRDRGRRAAAEPGQVGGQEAAQGDREVSRHRLALR